jgi:hypothetical protein
MSKLLSTLNWRLIIIQLVSFWFFFYGFQILSFLKDPALANPMLNSIIKTTEKPRYALDETFIEQMGNIGLVAAYILWWFIASKRDWHWINGVIAFIVAFALGALNWFGWNHVSNIFLAPGRLFNQTSIWNFLLSGSIMLALGLLLALWKKVQLFIDKGSYVDKKAIEEDNKKKRVR